MPRLNTARLLAACAIGLVSCAEESDEHEQRHERIAEVSQAIGAPLPAAFCTTTVSGIGDLDTELDYLPHVITCENGGANLQALKVQAIAARSVAYYNMAGQGSICDGQGCQVYSCGAEPQDIHYQAVAETSGMYLSYADTLTYGFYVAGDTDTAAPSCVGATGATEHWITYNEGKSGTDVEQTELGFVGPPGFGQNRGCMGQWGARCLEESGYDHDMILRFYYGADIQILQAPGPCVEPIEPAQGGAGGGTTASSGGAAEGGAAAGAGGEGGGGGDGGAWEPDDDDDDCSCRAAGSDSGSAGSLVTLMLLGIVIAARAPRSRRCAARTPSP